MIDLDAILDDVRDVKPLARHCRALVAEVRRLLAQLPEGMQNCTIQFKECYKGHGWLTATNWVQHGCPTCEVERLRAVLAWIAAMKHDPSPWILAKVSIEALEAKP